jgi:hypothetical protein
MVCEPDSPDWSHRLDWENRCTVNDDESSENHLLERQEIGYRMEVPVFGILVRYCICCSGKAGFRKRADSSTTDTTYVTHI